MKEYLQHPVLIEPGEFNGHVQHQQIVAKTVVLYDEVTQTPKWRLSWEHIQKPKEAIIGEGASPDEASTNFRRAIVTRYDPLHFVVSGKLPGHHNLSLSNYHEYKILRNYISERPVTLFERFIKNPAAAAALRGIAIW